MPKRPTRPSINDADTNELPRLATDAEANGAAAPNANGKKKGRRKTPKSPRELPGVIGSAGLFPHLVSPIALGEAVARAIGDDGEGREVVIAIARDGDKIDREKPILEQLHPIATVATVLKSLRAPDGQMRALVHGGRRVRLLEAKRKQGLVTLRFENMAEEAGEELRAEALKRGLLDALQRVVQIGPLPDEMLQASRQLRDAGRLADFVASHINLPQEQVAEALAEPNGVERLEKVYRWLLREETILSLSNQVQQKARAEIETAQREFFLREQMKKIRQELGEAGEPGDEIDEMRARLKAKSMPDAARQVAEKELARLERVNVSSPEHTVIRTYVDWLLALPWTEESETNLDIARAREVLDEDHYDLAEVKDRILEYLSVLKLTGGKKATILCFVGPPGVGKTSLGRSIARAMGRPFHRFSLGGIRDEAEIRGHRRTYIGAMPGRVVKAIKMAGVRNPVVMLDEVDKIGSDFRGDPASALLEVLDPEQNSTFMDNYLDVPYDLSRVVFITTANMLDTIPGPLRDRMEVIRIGGYALSEKLEIAKRHVVPKALEANGLDPKTRFAPAALKSLIEHYTREAGLRSLERAVGRVCRKIARKVAEGGKPPKRVELADLRDYMGPETFPRDDASKRWQPGIATGLAWTQYGGEVLRVEVNGVEGKGRLNLTGQLGDVMKESAAAALSFLQSRAKKLNLPAEAFDKRDLHVHLPAGAIPKDGPSAGIAIASAIASEMLGKRIDRKLAMTGEITLKGMVLPVGGVKEKALAAARAGIKRMILPELNRHDLEKLPEEVRERIEFLFVEDMDAVLGHVFGGGSERAKKPTKRS